jgi:KDO2-lipid IV(A) lauroyltransferase
MSAGKNFLNEHFIIDNPEILEPYRREGRRCQLQLGHSFNWEYANNGFALLSGQPLIVIYMPIGNRIFNRLLNHIRSKTGAIQIPATDARKQMLAFRHQPYILTLVADQAPGSPEMAYWLNFFGRPTPFVRSPERSARSGNTPAIFVHFYKSSRGKYRAKLFSGSEAPGSLTEGELTRRYVEFLQWSIREQPALYLWSHNRWKYPWKPEYQSRLID